MKETLHKLIDLMEVDHQIANAKEQLDLYPKMIAEMDAKETRAKNDIARAEKKFQESRETRRKMELEVKALREKIDKYVAQQNQVKTNKEYEAITHEIDGVKAKIDEMDLAGIEALENEDAGEKEKAQAESDLKALIEKHAGERERIDGRKSEKQSILDELNIERARRIETLQDDVQEIYQLLNDRYPGQAMAKIPADACEGCGMKLTKHVVQDVKRATSLIRCEGCMRILYDPMSFTD